MRSGETRSGAYVWRDTYNDEQTGVVAYEGYLGPEQGYLRLQYTVKTYSGEAHPMDYRIALTTTRPPFGGVRWWFICPRSGRRVMKLHLPLGARTFAARQVWRLPYASQRETAYDRAIRRAGKLSHRLGGEAFSAEFPAKPKGMRWATYNRLLDQIEAAEGASNDRLVEIAAKLMARGSR